MNSNIDVSLLQKEVLVSTDICGQFWNVCVWDYNSGTNLQTYKNSSTVGQGLAFLGNDYMLCAAYNKPYIVCWNLKGKPQSTKINTAGCVSCLATSKCGNYAALGIQEKIFILQVHSGRILNVLTRHLQNVSCIRFSQDDRYLITASDDTLILAWDFNEVLTTEREYLKPAFTWNAHSMRINDLYISPVSDRVVSVSSDQTCKIWNFTSESCMPSQNLLFQSAPTSCVFDHLESNLYVGLVNGTILGISIKTILHDTDKLMTDSMDNKSFLGHNKKITSLCVSLDDFTMASGSDDSTIRVWDTHSRQCIKIINNSGEITNLQFKHRTLFFNEEQNQVSTIFGRYTIDTNQQNQANGISTVSRTTTGNSMDLDDFIGVYSAGDNCQEEYFELKAKYESMKKINEKIYRYSLEKIFT
jgi:pre-rRNA-processing protein IPI3